MSTVADNDNARQGSGQAGEADSLELDGRQAMKGRVRPQTMGPTERLAETQRAAAEGQASKPPVPVERADPDRSSMRPEGAAAAKRRAIPPLEDRFNVKRVGLVDKEYHFRDQTGKVAFTDKFMSISTGSESPAALKAMVDRAAERGWETVRLNGSPEFVRQGWIAATAQGLKPVGHTATVGDREAAAKERARLQVSQDGTAPQRPREAIRRVQSDQAERVSGDRKAAVLGGQRQLAAAIEKAIADGRVSPELRGQVRAMIAAEGASRVASGEQFKVPVYDPRAPRARAMAGQAGPQRHGDRERSR